MLKVALLLAGSAVAVLHGIGGSRFISHAQGIEDRTTGAVWKVSLSPAHQALASWEDSRSWAESLSAEDGFRWRLPSCDELELAFESGLLDVAVKQADEGTMESAEFFAWSSDQRRDKAWAVTYVAGAMRYGGLQPSPILVTKHMRHAHASCVEPNCCAGVAWRQAWFAVRGPSGAHSY